MYLSSDHAHPIEGANPIYPPSPVPSHNFLDPQTISHRVEALYVHTFSLCPPVQAWFIRRTPNAYHCKSNRCTSKTVNLVYRGRPRSPILVAENHRTETKEKAALPEHGCANWILCLLVDSELMRF